MKKLLWFVALFLTGFVFAEETAPPAPSPLAPLESLVGGLWVASIPVPKDQSPIRIELKLAWAENKKAIRFDSTFIRGGKHLPYTSGFYAWNAAEQKIAIFYADSAGSLVAGLITRDGETFVNDLVSVEADGKKTPIQVRLTKDGADAFTNAIFLQKDGAWTSFVTVRYERQGL